jgi:hypothetical protein
LLLLLVVAQHTVAMHNNKATVAATNHMRGRTPTSAMGGVQQLKLVSVESKMIP